MSSNEKNKQVLPKEVKITLEKPFIDKRGGIQPLVDMTMKSCVLISSKKVVFCVQNSSKQSFPRYSKV